MSAIGTLGASSPRRKLLCIACFALFAVPVVAFQLCTYFTRMYWFFYVLMAFSIAYLCLGVRQLRRREYQRALCFLLPLLLQFYIAGGPIGRWLGESSFKLKLALTENYGRNCQLEPHSETKAQVHFCEMIVYSSDPAAPDILVVVYDASDGLAYPNNCLDMENRVPKAERAYFPWSGEMRRVPITCKRISGHYFGIWGPIQ